MQHIVDQLADEIRTAAAHKRPLRLRGGGTKDFYGNEPIGDVLDTRAYSGVVDYEPTELVVTARAGTPIAELQGAMRERGQMIGFEPPRYGEGATLGGCIAAGLSGPRRPYAGSARDLMLGVKMIDGKGTVLRFGGQVMKNVAGYDVTRLMAGSLGTLGVILEVSLKALPLPQAEWTLRREHTADKAIALMNAWAGQPLPISGTCHFGGALYVRLSGAEPAVRAARQKLGGEEMTDAASFWRQVRDHRIDLLQAPVLWRVSLKSTVGPLASLGPELIEWNGALRWIAADADAAEIRKAASRAGGHATLFRGGDRTQGVFHPLSPVLQTLHRRLKETFDPDGILNRGRLYSEL